MIARRLVTVLATLLAAPTLGACANPAPAPEARRGEPTTATVRAAAREAHPAGRRETAVRNVPQAFPLPPGSHVTDLSDRGSGASFTLTAPDPESVLSFYRHQLPRGPFTIVADTSAPDGATSLSFRDADGWAGAIYATARRVTVAVKRA
ncbi:hypothetical protein [Paractinoplanes brasiliensis]|uniref:Secreted protein n=1 Tax=Paractinoplanes brasiliensis TaxID=52695 RepID=A0A4R6JB23_9ACTN|nr:hypothetical protein [Actinoplanes brasiliensis]TDO32879.1 hypothetical protein C8E87_8354 [Actinoplanes brasiliensis]GID31576.1 hypothetical protein Abr02nite_65590 [Actinoplanes brasiliensis]